MGLGSWKREQTKTCNKILKSEKAILVKHFNELEKIREATCPDS
jgi:hypothetical protein